MDKEEKIKLQKWEIKYNNERFKYCRSIGIRITKLQINNK